MHRLCTDDDRGALLKVATARVRARVADHLRFLRVVDAHADVLYDPRILRLAVARYEHLWLPLCAAQPKSTLRAPLDIEFVWHCHLLNPVQCGSSLPI